MDSKPLVEIWGNVASLSNPSYLADTAMGKYGEIRTFFTKYTNPVGIELEIEGCSGDLRSRIGNNSIYWQYHSEGSLKDNGQEYVSSPLSGQNIDYAIHEFAQLTKEEHFKYSIRTSTHVHMNVSFMNYDEFVSLILMSAYLEPLLYTLCDPSRKGNPYCYPIGLLSPSEVFSLNEELKYCGINTAPVCKQLTVEYRQLHGTNDWRLLRRWVQVLSKIYYFCKQKPYKEVKQELKHVIKTKQHDLVKRVLGASIVLFPDLRPAEENLSWILAAMLYAENN